MTKTKNSTTRDARKEKPKQLITPAEAFAMLESAIHHCQRAGLTIGAENRAGALVLNIPGAAYLLTHGGTRAALVLAEEIAPTPGSASATN